MKNFIIVFLLTSMFLVIFTSCSTSFTYIVNPQNIPNFSKAHQTNIEVGVSAQDEFANFGHISMAHSISEKQAIIGGFSYLHSNNYDSKGPNSNYWAKDVTAYYVNTGFGVFKKVKNRQIFENYYGLGQGSVVSKEIDFEMGNATNNKRSYDIKYFSVFNQTSISKISKNKWVSAIFSVRVSGQYHYNINLTNYEIDYFKDLRKHPLSLFIQPNIMMKIGKNKLKASVYFTTDIDTNPLENSCSFLCFPNNPQPILGMGLSYSFD